MDIFWLGLFRDREGSYESGPKGGFRPEYLLLKVIVTTHLPKILKINIIEKHHRKT